MVASGARNALGRHAHQAGLQPHRKAIWDESSWRADES
jgi:hypothetical protein